MSADQSWETQKDDVFNIVADIDPPSAQIQYAFLAGYKVAEDEIAHLLAAAPQLRDALAWAVEWMEHYDGEVMPEWRAWSSRGRAALDAAVVPPGPEVERRSY